jgi:hypothetical protein
MMVTTTTMSATLTKSLLAPARRALTPLLWILLRHETSEAIGPANRK